jgi:hypothetical protein
MELPGFAVRGGEGLGGNDGAAEHMGDRGGFDRAEGGIESDGVQGGKWPEWLLNGTPRPNQRFTFTTHRFYTKDDPLQPSGLMGPVTIWAVQ